MTYQSKVIAATLAAVAGLVDERAEKVDTETADGALFSRCIQIRRAESERIERRSIVTALVKSSSRMTKSRDRSSSGRPHSCVNSSAKACSRVSSACAVLSVILALIADGRSSTAQTQS